MNWIELKFKGKKLKKENLVTSTKTPILPSKKPTMFDTRHQHVGIL